MLICESSCRIQAFTGGFVWGRANGSLCGKRIILLKQMATTWVSLPTKSFVLSVSFTTFIFIANTLKSA